MSDLSTCNLFAQYLPNLRKLNFHFWNQNDNRSFKKVEMQCDGCVDVERGDAEMRVCHRFRLAVKSLNPNTLCNLRSVGSELSLSAAGECFASDEDASVSAFLKSIKDGHALVCKFCNAPLVKLTSVQRVRPFPVSTDGFFCHPEDGANVAGGSDRVLPTEVWFDGHQMAFNHVLIAKQHLRNAKGRLECVRCALPIGRSENGVCLIATEAVNVQLDELDVDGDPIGIVTRPLVDNDNFLNLLCYGLQMNDVTRAIVIADNESQDELFLVWLLEKPSMTFQAEWTNGEERVELKPQRSQKILFQPLLGCPARDPETESWSRDLSVHRIVVNEEMGRRLLQHLLLNCLRLPPLLRKASVFRVAILVGGN